MIEMNGNNVFLNNIYDPERWSAGLLQMPEEVVTFFKNTQIAGRKIQHIYTVGPAYNLSKEWIQNFAIAIASKHNEENPENPIPPLIECIPADSVFSRFILLDQPLIIEFDSGDRFEILFSRCSEVRMSINKLPKELRAPNALPNVDCDILFSDIIDKRILRISVGRRKDVPEDWPEPHGEDWKEQDTLISYIMFETDGDAALVFEPYKETGRVYLIGRDKKIRAIHYGDLRPGLTMEPLGDGTEDETQK